MALAFVALSGCTSGGDGSGPVLGASIQSFTATSTLIRAGDAVEFTAVFEGEDAVLVPGGVSLTSGVPASVTPLADTTYAVVVSSDDGSLATADIEISVVDFLFTVVSDADSGPGTLREAMELAAEAPVLRTAITFDLPTPATITLASDLPNVVGVLRLVGPGVADDLVIDGADAHRILFVNGGRAVVTDLTLQHGRAQGGDGGSASNWGGGGGGAAAGMGGAAFLNAGILSCTRVRFVENDAVGGAGGAGRAGPTSPPFNPPAGGGGGGAGGPGAAAFSVLAGAGGPGGPFGGAGGVGAMPGNGILAGAGGEGAGGGGGPYGAAAGPGGFGGGGGGSGITPYTPAGGGSGGFGAGGGGGDVAGAGGTHGGGGGGATSAPGGGGGAGLGGAIFGRAGSLSLIDCAFSANSAVGGADGGGGALEGTGKGGALYVMPTATAILAGTTFVGNAAADDAAAPGDDDDVFGDVD